MDVVTPDGIKIYCLPDCAKCSRTGISPIDMDHCPIFQFDNFGDRCIPELCDEYREERL